MAEHFPTHISSGGAQADVRISWVLSPMSSEADSSAEEQKRFAVAFSFSGRHRAYVKIVAEALKRKLNGNAGEPKREVLYDKDYWGQLSGPDVHLRLPDWYEKEAQLVVVFVSDDYKDKYWCKREWDRIKKNYLKSFERKNRLMPIFIGDRFESDGNSVTNHYEDSLRALGLDTSEWGVHCVHDDGLDEVVEQIHAKYQESLALIQRRMIEGRAHDAFIQNVESAEQDQQELSGYLYAHVDELLKIREETETSSLVKLYEHYDTFFERYKKATSPQERSNIADEAARVLNSRLRRHLTSKPQAQPNTSDQASDQLDLRLHRDPSPGFHSLRSANEPSSQSSRTALGLPGL
jgi:hypothetical protein